VSKIKWSSIFGFSTKFGVEKDHDIDHNNFIITVQFELILLQFDWNLIKGFAVLYIGGMLLRSIYGFRFGLLWDFKVNIMNKL